MNMQITNWTDQKSEFRNRPTSRWSTDFFDKEAKQRHTSKLIISCIYIYDACISTSKIKFLSMNFTSFTKAAKICADLNIKWKTGWALWHMPLFPTLERQEEVDLFELEAIMVSRPARTTVRFCFNRNKQNNNKKCKIISLLEDLGNLWYAEVKTTQYMKEKLILYFI